jgi:acyl-coenzyme A synthetase/AMP-(fatty) acid ligase
LSSTNARRPDAFRLRRLVERASTLRIETATTTLRGDEVAAQAVFPCAELRGKSLLIGARSQLATARALIELDGVAARLAIAPPDFAPDRLASLLGQAECDAIICDTTEKDFGVSRPILLAGAPGAGLEEADDLASEWVLPTSGTSGPPKLVAHRLSNLLGPIGAAPAPADAPVWATFYDIRRYGGLQIFLRAIVAGARLLLSEGGEALGGYMARCGEAGVTHISGTPSHWRRLLMSPYANRIDPQYIRLSGEIADRGILEALRAAYPKAQIVHAYASTEAGVGFEVADGREGFPASLLTRDGDVEIKLEEGALRIRSPRTALRYIGQDAKQLQDQEGFVDTGDMVELIGDRCFFKGRRSGAINIGGLKAHPEEIEQVINSHGRVRMSRVSARRNPILGGLVAADVVLKDAEDAGEALKEEIMGLCHARLPRHMAPATIRFVPALELLASGKLARDHA